MFVESGNFVIPPAFDVPVRGRGVSFGTEKLERCGYPTVTKFDYV